MTSWITTYEFGVESVFLSLIMKIYRLLYFNTPVV